MVEVTSRKEIIMEVLDWIAENLDTIIATVLIVLASFDKVAIVAMGTLRNVLDEWNSLFGK